MKCTICGKDKLNSEFGSRLSSGHVIKRRQCKKCRYDKQKKWFYRNKRRVLDRQNEWRTKKRRKMGIPERITYIDKMTSDEYRNHIRQNHKKYIQTHPEIMMKARIKWRCGVSMDVMFELLKKQDGKCAICSCPISFEGKDGTELLQIDHCHETLRVRGFLCKYCNHALGSLKDDVKRMESAIKYIKNFKSNPLPYFYKITNAEAKARAKKNNKITEYDPRKI